MSAPAPTPNATPAPPPSPPATRPTAEPARAARRRASLAGLLATAASLGVAELVAGALGARSLVVGIGDAVIDRVPGWLERFAVSTLGTADKPVLVVGVLVASALLGAALGRLARTRLALACAGLVAVGGLGVAASLTDARTTPAEAVTVAAAGAVAGVVALVLLTRAAGPAGAGPAGPARPTRSARSARSVDTDPTLYARRRFLVLASASAAAGVLGAAGGRLLASPRIDRLRETISLPRPTATAVPLPPGAGLAVEGLTPLRVPNADFYRIDTALLVPEVDPAGWSLEVRGMVDRPFTLTYDELLALATVESDVTLACVSNEVGGGLVGNARWQGVPLRDLLERAGVQPGATQIIGRSVDGFTAGFPVELGLRAGPGPGDVGALVAVGMNGEPLPQVHGFPARLVVPGLYGYVSATKWLSAIELTTFDEQGYWIPRGWSREGPVKTQARIDVPRRGVPAGRQPVAGVAWAPGRGIDRVEVRVDDGPWQRARLSDSLGVDAWRQWVWEWDAAPGTHTLTVRATDGTGEVQTSRVAPPAPDGASGHHSVRVVVS